MSGGDHNQGEGRVIATLERWEGYGHGYYNVHPDASLPCSVCALIADVRAALRGEVSS